MDQFYPWFKLYFPLFWGFGSLKQEKRKFKPTTKFNQNIYTLQKSAKTAKPKSTFLKLVLDPGRQECDYVTNV